MAENRRCAFDGIPRTFAQVRCGTGSVASELRNPRSATEVIGQTRVADIPRQHYCPIQIGYHLV